MNVINLPLHRPTATLAVRSIGTSPGAIADDVLFELLRKAVAAYRSGEVRVPGSLSHRHHLALSHAFLDSISVVMGDAGIAKELGQCLSVGITDIRRLGRIAREFDGPQSA